MIRSLSTLIEDFLLTLRTDTVSLAAILEAFHERGIAFVLILFAAPMALPIPVPPGLNIALATPLILLTAQQALGAHRIWLPRRAMRKTIEREKFAAMMQGLLPWIRRLETLIRPRLGWITRDGPSRLVGLMGLIMALTVCIPVPLTNTVPSLGITLMSVGVVMRDGLVVLIGAAIGLAWVALLTAGVVLYGPEAVEIIKNALKSVL